MLNRTRSILAVAVVAALAGLVSFFVRVCADGGAMGSAYMTCQCIGIEWELYDRTAADGPRRTLCIGTLESRTCHRFREGRVVECSP